jgi:predicted Fe-Mo cluster-binding NifX family protein
MQKDLMSAELPPFKEKEQMKIAITSQNFRTITGHAGKASRFLIFDADPLSGDIKEAERLEMPKEMAMHSFSGDQHPLYKVDVFITGSCGAGFRKRMEMHGVKVITTSERDPFVAAQAVAKGETLATPLPHSHEQLVSIQIK